MGGRCYDGWKLLRRSQCKAPLCSMPFSTTSKHTTRCQSMFSGTSIGGTDCGRTKRFRAQSATWPARSSRSQHCRRKLHGDIGWRGKKHNRELFGLHRLRRAWHLTMPLALDGLWPVAGVPPMLKEYGFDGGMPLEQTHEFRTTIAPKSDDAGTHG